MSEFYVGWSGGTVSSKKTTLKFFLCFIVLMLVIVSVFTLFERPFADSTFSYGELSEMEGELLEEPVVSLRVSDGDSFEIVPLVGYGKMGPHTALSDLLGKGSFEVRLRGTLIQYKGNKLFELTEGSSSVLNANEIEPSEMAGSMGSSMEVSGEIVDPKCFFGVMKPGYGKVHKSCAIRCISGQIPPILAIRENGEFMNYYFLTDRDGRVLMMDLHEYVGTLITVTGISYEIDNWRSIRVENLELATLLDKNLTICSL